MLRRIVFLLSFLLVAFSHWAKADPYFLPGTWPEDLTPAYEVFHGRLLAGMAEPSLAKGSEATEIRLLFLPRFCAPHMVRLTVTTERAMRLVYKTTTGPDGCKPERVVHERHGIIPPDKAARLVDAIDQMGVWSRGAPLEKPEPRSFCPVDQQVFFEFARSGTWIPVIRYDCEMEADDPLRLLIKEMGALAGHPFDPHSFERPTA